MRNSTVKAALIKLLAATLVLTAIGLWAKDWPSENIRLSNSKSSPTVKFQILPNTQKFEVYDSLACEGCNGHSSALFSPSEFPPGQAPKLIQTIELSTGVKAPDGVDADVPPLLSSRAV